MLGLMVQGSHSTFQISCSSKNVPGTRVGRRVRSVASLSFLSRLCNRSDGTPECQYKPSDLEENANPVELEQDDDDVPPAYDLLQLANDLPPPSYTEALNMPSVPEVADDVLAVTDHQQL